MDIHSVRTGQVSLPELGTKSDASKVPSQTKPTASNTAPSPAEVQKAVQKLQANAGLAKGDIEFSTDQDTGREVVKVVDKTTKDVLMQFPSKQALEIAKNLDANTGKLINQEA